MASPPCLKMWNERYLNTTRLDLWIIGQVTGMVKAAPAPPGMLACL